MNHRELLGVSPSASASEIQSAFRSAAKETHPDYSDSPEAAEAFARIKEARDALLADNEPKLDQSAIRSSVAQAFHATAQAGAAAYQPQATTTPDPIALKKRQELDDLARQKPKHSFFKKTDESPAVRAHRKKIQTSSRRIQGLY